MKIKNKKNCQFIFILLALTTFSSAPYALAHSSIPKDSMPKANEIVKELPSSVFVDFKDEIEPGTATLVVLDPTESNLAGKATSKGNRITASLIKTSKYSGIYKVSYRAISVDGTTIQSFFTFGLSEREDRKVHTSSAPKDKSGVIVTITLLVIPLAVVLFTLNKRKRRVK